MNRGLDSSQLAFFRNERVIFADLAFGLEPGRGLLVTGPNGSGKSSLLRVLAGLICPTMGTLCWKGRDILEDRLAYFQDLHFLGHQHGIKNKLSVKENLLYSQNLAARAACDDAVQAAMEKLDLLALQEVTAQHLSAGQKQRLALARLLATPKPLWILDEPFTNLDQGSQNTVTAILEQHLQQQGLIILASHQALKLQQSDLFQTLSLAELSEGQRTHV